MHAGAAQKAASKTPAAKAKSVAVAANTQPSRLVAQTPDDELGIEDEIEDDFSPGDPVPQRSEGPDAVPGEPSVPGEEVAEPTEPPPETTPAQPREEYRPSASSGEKIFDWSKHQGEREVPHPFREKGLIRITRDKDYIYKVDESDQKRAFDFKAGMFDPQNLANPETGVTFEENYQQTQNPAFMINYEWQLWHSPVGKWGIRAGTGAFVAQGNGHFASNSANAGLIPREVFTFILVPLNVGAVYRLQIWHRQMLVPYAEGGGTLFGFAETRDDDKPPKFGGSTGAYFAGGVALNLTYFDALSRIQLDREYGINAVFLTAEYRHVESIQKSYDFTSDLVNAGFLMEY